MVYTGKPNPVEDEFDIDHKINEVVELTEKHIKELIDEVGQENFNKIAKVVLEVYIKNINGDGIITITTKT